VGARRGISPGGQHHGEADGIPADAGPSGLVLSIAYCSCDIRPPNSTSFLLAHGTSDDIVDPTQTETFLKALKQSRFYVRKIDVPTAPHFWMADPIEETNSFSGFLAPRLLRFLADRL